MSRIPDELPELGETSLAFSPTPGFDPAGASISSEDYFVLSRCDGRTSTRDLILMTGLPTERAVAVLQRLRALGAILLPGESADEVRARAAKLNAVAAVAEAEIDVTRPIAVGQAQQAAEAEEQLLVPDDLDEAEQASLRADSILSEQERLRVLHMRRRTRADHFSLLGVDRDVDTKTLKRTYFKLSKQFHPDRYYGKALGAYDEWLHEVFEAISEAFQVVSDPVQRHRYLRSLDGGAHPAAGESQSPPEYAAELFERACHAEVTGDLAEAVGLFAACLRVHPAAKYLSRAARCAVRAGNGAAAVQFATQSRQLDGQNPSVLRVLADAQRVAGDLEGAERTLLEALALKSENDHLTNELRHDLDAVRSQRGGG